LGGVNVKKVEIVVVILLREKRWGGGQLMRDGGGIQWEKSEIDDTANAERERG